MTLLKAEDITVADGATRLLHPVSLHLDRGEPLVILGETGSGKSLLAQALMGTLPEELSARGRVAIGDRLLDAARPAGFRPLWGREIAVLPQEPWLSLDPLMRAERQVREAHRLVRGLSAAEARFGSDLLNTRSTTWRGLSEAERAGEALAREREPVPSVPRTSSGQS